MPKLSDKGNGVDNGVANRNKKCRKDQICSSEWWNEDRVIRAV